MISDLNDEGTVGKFYEKDFEKSNQPEFRIENVIIENKILNINNLVKETN